MICLPLLLLGDCDEMRLLGVSYEAYAANKHSMEGQNFYALSLEQCLLEPHDLRSVGLTILGIIALYCAIVNSGLCNFLFVDFIKMASLTGLTIAKSHIAIEFALFSHDIGIHTVLLSAYSHIKLFVGTLYKTLDKYYQAGYNQRQY